MKDKRYLGDAMYVQHDGFHVWLTTEDGVSVTNRIALEPKVFDALIKYREDLHREEPTEEQIYNWPEGAVFKKGEILRHAMGFEGPCESAYQRDGYIAYYIKIRTTSIGGPAHVFKRVEVE